MFGVNTLHSWSAIDKHFEQASRTTSNVNRLPTIKGWNCRIFTNPRRLRFTESFIYANNVYLLCRLSIMSIDGKNVTIGIRIIWSSNSDDRYIPTWSGWAALWLVHKEIKTPESKSSSTVMIDVIVCTGGVKRTARRCVGTWNNDPAVIVSIIEVIRPGQLSCTLRDYKHQWEQQAKTNRY